MKKYLLLFLGLMACTPAPETLTWPRGVVSDQVSEELIGEAVEAWNEALGFEAYVVGEYPEGVNIYVDVAPLFGNPPYPLAIGMAYTWGLGDPRCSISLDPSAQDNLAVLIHELGHCLWLRHSRNIESIMYPTVLKDTVQTIQDEDVAKVLAWWGGAYEFAVVD